MPELASDSEQKDTPTISQLENTVRSQMNGFIKMMLDIQAQEIPIEGFTLHAQSNPRYPITFEGLGGTNITHASRHAQKLTNAGAESQMVGTRVRQLLTTVSERLPSLQRVNTILGSHDMAQYKGLIEDEKVQANCREAGFFLDSAVVDVLLETNPQNFDQIMEMANTGTLPACLSSLEEMQRQLWSSYGSEQIPERQKRDSATTEFVFLAQDHPEKSFLDIANILNEQFPDNFHS